MVGVDVALGGSAPTEVPGHAVELELAICLRVIVVGRTGPANRVGQREGGRVFELKAGAFASAFNVLLDRVDQPAGRAHDGRRAIAHGVELGEAAGFGPARHDEEIAAGLNEFREFRIKSHMEPEFTREARGGLAK